jgi:hypothetical protein
VGRRRRPIDGHWIDRADSSPRVVGLTRANGGKQGDHRYPGGLGTHQGRDTGTHQGRDQGSGWGTDPGTNNPTKQLPNDAPSDASELQRGITCNSDGSRVRIGLGAAGTLHPAAFGRCPRPAGTTTRPKSARRQGRSSSAATPAPVTVRGRRAACGRSTLTPGRAGWSQGHWVGRSARPAATPPGEGAAAPADQRV